MISKRNEIAAAAGLALVLAFGGVAFPGQGRAQEVVQASSQVTVKFAERGLSRSLKVEGARLAQVGPVVRVQLAFANTTSKPIDIQYAAQWKDVAGFELRSNARWESARVDAMTTRSIDLLGNSAEIASVVVNVKTN